MKKLILALLIIGLFVATAGAKTPWTSKPPVGAQIDWSHPLSKGLIGCWLFNEKAGVSTPNLVTNERCVYNLTKPWLNTQKGIGPGPNIQTWTSNSADGINTQFNNSAFNGKHTIIICAKPLTLAQTGYQNQGWFNYGTSMYSGVCRMSNTGTIGYEKYNKSTANYAARTTDALIIAGKIQTVAITWDGTTLGSGIHIYIDGKEATYFATNDGTVGTGLYTTVSLGLGSVYQFWNAGWFSGVILYVYAYNHILFPQEIQQLYIDPYCFIKEPYRYYVPAGAPTITEYLDLLNGGFNTGFNMGLSQ